MFGARESSQAPANLAPAPPQDAPPAVAERVAPPATIEDQDPASVAASLAARLNAAAIRAAGDTTPSSKGSSEPSVSDDEGLLAASRRSGTA